MGRGPLIVVDTHVWIWWVSAPHLLSRAAARALDAASEISVSPISVWEIATKVARGRLDLDRDLRTWVAQALDAPGIQIAPIEPEIAIVAGTLGERGFHGDPADRIITATAMHHRVPLVTKDATIHRFSGVRALW